MITGREASFLPQSENNRENERNLLRLKTATFYMYTQDITATAQMTTHQPTPEDCIFG